MTDEVAHRIFPTTSAERLQAYFERCVEPIPVRPRSKSEWLVRRAEVRAHTLCALGLTPMPDRLPLEVRKGGCLEREGYRVERVYWQTWPEVWAGGWLYLPGQAQGPLPAVLNPHGHWEGGARHPGVQHRLITLARLGYVALAVDSEHVYDYSLGVTPLTVMTLNNLRALDFLTSLPEVDRERLGVTGASGGAQQAMYLLAVDDRVRVAVLAAMTTYFRRILTPEGHHCPCNHVPGIMRFADELELCGVASPRALLFLTVTGDWTAEFPQHELGELRQLYHLWQQPDRLAHRQFAGPHDYSREMREAAYTWFERELRGNARTPLVTEPELSVEDPAELAALDAVPEGHRGKEGILDWFRKRVIAQPPQLESRAARRSYQDRTRAALRDLLGDEPRAVSLETTWHELPGLESPHCSGLGMSGLRGVSFRTEPDVRIPALWLPAPVGRPAPAVIALHPDGKSAALQMPLIQEMHSRGFAVLAPDVRLRGEMSRDWLHNTILWGRPEAGMAVRDVQACIDWLYEFPDADVDVRSLVLVGEGDQGLVAMLAAGLDERVSAVVGDAGETTYRDGGDGLPVIPNILRVADVPQVASLVAPRPLWLYRVPKERVGFSSRRYYDWTRRTFQSLGELDAVTMESGPPAAPAKITDWLGARLRRVKR